LSVAYAHAYIIPFKAKYYYIVTSVGHVLKIEALIEIGVEVLLHARRKEWLVFGAWGNHVACAQ